MSEEFEDMSGVDEQFPIRFNYDKVSKDRSFLGVTRLLALDLIDNPYLSVGTFVQGISESDLYEFMSLIESNEEKAMENLMIITEMLAQAEGLQSESLDQLTYRCNVMTGYITIESLKRKGLVKVYYEHMSFGEEFAKKIIVERAE